MNKYIFDLCVSKVIGNNQEQEAHGPHRGILVLIYKNKYIDIF